MSVRIIYILAIFLISVSVMRQNKYNYTAKIFHRKYDSSWSKPIIGLYDATQIGYKRLIDKNLKVAFQNLGIMHLLTPSGIHLASILIVLNKLLPKSLLKLILVVFYIFININGGFHSIRRILCFCLLKDTIKSSKLNFYITFAIDLIIGGYSSSALSFSLSFLFWGVIIFSNKNKVELLINLFFSQALISFFFNAKISMFSIIINPIITSIFSSSFFLLSFQYWLKLSMFENFAKLYLVSFSNATLFISEILQFSLTQSGVLIFLFVIMPKRTHILALLVYIIFNTQSLNRLEFKNQNFRYYLKEAACKAIATKYGLDKKCLKKDIKKAQTSWAI